MSALSRFSVGVIATLGWCISSAQVTTLRPPNDDGALFGYGFGHTVALSDTDVIVGTVKNDAPPNDGSALVFDAAGSGHAPRATLKPPIRRYRSSFGFGVAAAPGILVAGANGEYDNVSGMLDPAVYVFDSGSLQMADRLSEPGPQNGPYSTFGASVAADGARIVSGGLRATNVIEKTAGHWAISARIPQTFAQGKTGYGVDISGDTIASMVYGVQLSDDVGFDVFHWNGTSWVSEGPLQMGGSSILAYPRRFSLKGDLLAVTSLASYHTTAKVHIYKRNPASGTWQETWVIPLPAEVPDYSGEPNVALDPPYLLAREGSLGNSVMVFRFDGANWKPSGTIRDPRPSTYSFGGYMALRGSRAVIATTSAPGIQGEESAGLAYVFEDVGDPVFSDGCE